MIAKHLILKEQGKVGGMTGSSEEWNISGQRREVSAAFCPVGMYLIHSFR